MIEQMQVSLGKLSNAEWLGRSSALGLPVEATSCLRAIMHWKHLLETPDGFAPRQVRAALASVGYLPDSGRLIGAARRSSASVEAACSTLVGAIVKKELTPSEIISGNNSSFRQLVPDLSQSQVKLLQHMVCHQQTLDSMDFTALRQQFVFPITSTNFFGRFIAGGGGSPEQAVRHLHLAAPFFHQLRSLFEALQGERKRFLTISSHDLYSGNQSDQFLQQGVELGPSEDLFQFSANEEEGGYEQTLLWCIEHNDDFYGEIDSSPWQPLCVRVPVLPAVELDHIQDREMTQLAAEFFNWLFFANRSGELLNRKSLPVSQEQEYIHLEKSFKEVHRVWDAHRGEEPDRECSQKQYQAWADREVVLAKRAVVLGERLEALDQKRGQADSILNQIDGADGVGYRLRRMRAEVVRALTEGRPLIFSLLGHHMSLLDPFGQTANCGGLYRLFDAAYTTRKFKGEPGIGLLRSSAWLFSPEAVREVIDNPSGGRMSVAHQQIREFNFPSSLFTSSVRLILGEDPQRRSSIYFKTFCEAIVSSIILPGVRSVSDLLHNVGQHSRKQKPGIPEVLAYTFEYAREITVEQMLDVFHILVNINHTEIPERCAELSLLQFNHPTTLFPLFNKYVAAYRPSKVGDLPQNFVDEATFDRYFRFGLDSYGMEPEVRQLEKLLVEHGIVAVVDGTSYHPEFNRRVFDEEIELSEGGSGEIWGAYVRPMERLVRSLSRHLIEGQISEELRNFSLVSVRQPSANEQMQAIAIRKFFGIDLDLSVDMGAVNDLLGDLALHDERTILVIDASSVKDLSEYSRFLQQLEKYNFKLVVRARQPLPGIPQVVLMPFSDYEIPQRLLSEGKSLQELLELDQPIDTSVLEFAAEQVRRFRRPEGDPLNYVLQIVNGSLAQTRTRAAKELTKGDVISALPSIFHLPDIEQTRCRLQVIDEFVKRAPLEVMGQSVAIKKVAVRMKAHLMGLTDPKRPLRLLLPGPTGVGKTELMMKLAQAVNIPFFHVEGAEFSESHSVSRLVGSPAGYVGADKGILIEFIDKNPLALCFFDEIEKMHPDVYSALMNFFDSGTLTAGDGRVYQRPGLIIVGASNAGAEWLHHGMEESKLREILAEAFHDREGRKRPEFVRRFEPILMLAIEKEEFTRMLRFSLNEVGERYGFLKANLELVDVDERAVELLYRCCQKVCEFTTRRMERQALGFNTGPVNLQSEGFFDLRYVGTALQDLAGASLQEIVEEQYLRMPKKGEQLPPQRRVQLIGQGELIRLVDV